VSELGSIEALAAADTHDLRRRVLRGGRADAQVDWDGDEQVDTMHLGVVVDGSVIAVSTWLVSDRRDDGRPRSVQLRGMATEPSLAGTGLGRRLLDAGIVRATESGAELVWANARIGALGFYEQAGFVPVGSVFEIPDVGLAHQRVEYPTSASST